MSADAPPAPAPPAPRTGRRAAVVAGAALPALLLAALGGSHPHVLTPESATWWRDLHVIGLVLFPLLAVPPWLVVRGRGRLLETAMLVLGLVYAAFYTALDAIAGIGGGAATLAVGPGPWVSSLFAIADQVVLPGVYAHLAAVVLAAVVTVATTRGAARVAALAGGVLAVAAAWAFVTSHIYHPWGTGVMVVLAAGSALLALAATSATAAGGREVAQHAERAPTGRR